MHKGQILWMGIVGCQEDVIRVDSETARIFSFKCDGCHLIIWNFAKGDTDKEKIRKYGMRRVWYSWNTAILMQAQFMVRMWFGSLLNGTPKELGKISMRSPLGGVSYCMCVL